MRHSHMTNILQPSSHRRAKMKYHSQFQNQLSPNKSGEA